MARLILFAVIGIIALIIAVIKIALGHVTGNQNLQSSTWRGESKKAMDKTARGLTWMEQQWEESKRRASVQELIPKDRIALEQYNLGCHLLKNQHYSEAATCFQRAAEQGIVEAQGNLGICYYEGKGVPQNADEAAKWFRLAAEQGNAVAQFALGRCYHLGQGVPHNIYEGVQWVRKAADQGYPEALGLLALDYYEGLGVSQDYIEAFKWVSLASLAGTNPDILRLHDELMHRLTPQEITEGQRRAEGFLSGHISAGTATAVRREELGTGQGFKSNEWRHIVKSVYPENKHYSYIDIRIQFSCDQCSEKRWLSYDEFTTSGWPLCEQHKIEMRPCKYGTPVL